MPAATSSSMATATHSILLVLPVDSWQNHQNQPPQPSAGYSDAWKGWIPVCRLWPRLLNPCPYTHKTNETCQQQPPAPWPQLHTVLCWFCPLIPGKITIKSSSSVVYSDAWKGWIPVCRLWPRLLNPFPYTHKANGTCQQQPSAPKQVFGIDF